MKKFLGIMNEERSKYQEGLQKIGVKIQKLIIIQKNSKSMRKENEKISKEANVLRQQDSKN